MYEKAIIAILIVAVIIELVYSIWASFRLDRTRTELGSCVRELEQYRAAEHNASESIKPVTDGINAVRNSIGAAIDTLRQSEARVNEQKSSIEQLRERLKILQEFEYNIRNIYNSSTNH